jgi:hypothetical protein
MACVTNKTNKMTYYGNNSTTPSVGTGNNVYCNYITALTAILYVLRTHCVSLFISDDLYVYNNILYYTTFDCMSGLMLCVLVSDGMAPVSSCVCGELSLLASRGQSSTGAGGTHDGQVVCPRRPSETIPRPPGPRWRSTGTCLTVSQSVSQSVRV